MEEVWHARCYIEGNPVKTGKIKPTERTQMNTMFIKLIVKLQELTNREEGQDLVEYALLVSLIALAAITGAGKVATAVNSAFSTISTSL